MDDFCLYAVAAADEALKDAGLPLDMRDGSVVNPDRVGVCVGSGIGGMRTMEQQCEVLLEKGQIWGEGTQFRGCHCVLDSFTLSR